MPLIWMIHNNFYLISMKISNSGKLNFGNPPEKNKCGGDFPFANLRFLTTHFAIPFS